MAALFNPNSFQDLIKLQQTDPGAFAQKSKDAGFPVRPKSAAQDTPQPGGLQPVQLDNPLIVSLMQFLANQQQGKK